MLIVKTILNNYRTGGQKTEKTGELYTFYTDTLSMRNTIIVIAGCQRSGTTLTGQILGAHSQCFLVDESDGLYPWMESELFSVSSSIELMNTVINKASGKYLDYRQYFRSELNLGSNLIVAKAPEFNF